MNDKQVEGKGARSGGGVRGEGGVGGYLTTRELSVVRDARATPLALEGGARSGNDHGVRTRASPPSSQVPRLGRRLFAWLNISLSVLYFSHIW